MSVPVVNLEFERAVLGLLLLGLERIPARVFVDGRLRPQHLYSERHRALLQAMLALHDAGTGIDESTVRAALRQAGTFDALGGQALLDDCAAQAGMPSSVAHYCAELRELAGWRSRTQAARELLAACESGDRSGVDRALTGLAAADAGRGSDSAYDPQEATDAVMRHAQGKTMAARWRWPLPRLNRLTHGGLRPGQVTFISGPTRHGKALDVETPILTPQGWTTMGELEVGGQVFGADGKPTTITDATPWMTGRPCYRVTFSDSSTVIADEEHLWTIDTHNTRASAAHAAARAGQQLAFGHNDQSTKRSLPKTVTTRELLDELERGTQPSIAVCRPLAHDHVDGLLLDPYVLGVWLGDGDSRNPNITCHEDDATFIADQLRIAGEHVEVSSAHGREHIKRIKFGVKDPVCTRGHRRNPEVSGCRECRRLASLASWRGQRLDDLAPVVHPKGVERLRMLGVWLNKHIPEQYLRASFSQRLALLQGIVDTDGHINRKSRQVDIAVTSEALADGIHELMLTLGIRVSRSQRPAKLYGREVGTAHRLIATTALPVARLPRKAARLPRCVSTAATHRYIRAIEPVESRPVRCIAVAAPDRLFLAGRTLIPTHNSVFTDQVLESSVNDGAKACLYLNEMDRDERAVRTAARGALVPHAHLATAQLTDKDARSLVRWGAEGGVNFRMQECDGWSAQDVARDARHRRLDVVAFDLLDELPLLAGMNRRETAEESMRVFKELALGAGCHVLVVGHLNRNRSSSSPTIPLPSLGDIRESGMLANRSHNVVFVWREQDRDTGDPLDEGFIRVAKARKGTPGGVAVVFDGDRQRFLEDARQLREVAA